MPEKQASGTLYERLYSKASVPNGSQTQRNFLRKGSAEKTRPTGRQNSHHLSGAKNASSAKKRQVIKELNQSSKNVFDKLHNHAMKRQEIQRSEIHDQYAQSSMTFDKVLRQDDYGSLGRSGERKPSPNRPRFNAAARPKNIQYEFKPLTSHQIP